MIKIVLASNNPGKIVEINELLSKETHIELISQATLNIPEIEETGITFVENAIIKARHASQLSGLPAISDDSGLAVDALQGAPGVFSARYAANDQDRIQKLLDALKIVPDVERTARYHSVMIFLRYAIDPAPIICHGIWEGKILQSPRGNKGFGYDPIFYVPTHQCSAAELETEEKNRISHRGQAMQQLINILKGFEAIGL